MFLDLCFIEIINNYMLSYLLSSQSSVEYKLQEYLTQNGDTFSEALLHSTYLSTFCRVDGDFARIRSDNKK